MITNFGQFEEIWCVDFEFGGGDGDRQKPICMVARELRTDTELRLWRTTSIGFQSLLSYR